MCSARYFFSDSNQALFSGQNLVKVSVQNFTKLLPLDPTCYLRRDRHDGVNFPLCNFANAPKKYINSMQTKAGGNHLSKPCKCKRF